MTCNNVILAQPQAQSSVSYTIPEGDSARLNFTPEDISGLSIGKSGELIISFEDGGQLTITNFQDLASSGNLIYMADGTLIDSSILTTSPQGPEVFTDLAAASGAKADPIIISQPAPNTTQEVAMQQGMKYICDFDPANAATVEIKDGQMVLTFADGSQVVINNYAQAMAGQLPAELTVADGTAIEPEALLTQVTEVAEPISEVLQVAQAEVEEPAEVIKVSQESVADKVANIEPAAGDEMADLADALADIETAAGEAAGASSNSGYGFNSSPTDVPLDSPDAIGPLGPTQLRYVAPQVQQENFFLQSIPDSIPTITFLQGYVDETNLGQGSLNATGQIIATYGNDTPGAITPSGTIQFICPLGAPQITAQGIPVTISQTTNGYVGTIDVGNNPITIFTFTIDPQTGVYEYNQVLPVDHPDTTDPNDEICINFGIKATDADGDMSLSNVRIHINDDGPVILSQTATVVDETDFTNGTLIKMGQFNADMGEDKGGSYSGNNTFSATGSVANNVLSSNGVAVTVTFDAVTNTYTGAAGNVTVFTLTLNPNTAAYTYTQFAPLSHADFNNPDDVINLEFGVTIKDGDGDTASGKITVQVHDDAPVTGDDVNTIDETGLSGGDIVINDSVSVDFGTDGQGKLAPSNVFSSSGSLAGGELTSNGVPIVVGASPFGYVGAAGGETIFTLYINQNTGEYSFTLSGNLDHADGSNPDDIITLNFGTIITDRDGDSDPGTITINIKDDVPSAVDDTNSLGDNVNVTTGNVLTNDASGSDTNTMVCAVSIGGKSINVPTSGVISVKGEFGTLTISADGSYTYERNYELATTGNSTFKSYSQDGGTDVFSYVMKDGDGDTDTATLTVTVTEDFSPIQINGVGQTDDTHLASGPDVINGTINVNYQGDGPGTTMGNNVFASSGAKGATLSSNGVPVVVTFDSASNTYTGKAGAITVFTMVIKADNSYTFTQHEQLDHSDTSNNNEALFLDFGVKATDSDGDTGTGTVRITVRDDAPHAVNDTATLAGTQKTATGNVLTNDSVGQDNGYSAVTTPGTYQGQYGTLIINANGTYTYTRFGDAGGTDTFNYTMRDGDGDLSTAKLTVGVTEAPCNVDAKNDDFRVFDLDAFAWNANSGDTVIHRADTSTGGWWDPANHQQTYYLSGGVTVHQDTNTFDGGFWYKLPVLQNDTSGLTITNVRIASGFTINRDVRISDDGQSILFRVGPDREATTPNANQNFTWDDITYLEYTVRDAHGCTDTAQVKISSWDATSPLVLDLDRDGVELLPLSEGVLFDMNLDGRAEQTGWVSSDDGLLVLDKNGDGIINDRTELFGDTEGFTDGFDNLSSYDSNSDGVIDANDSVYANLRVWQDGNSDGVSNAQELLTLAQIGIVSISLTTTQPEGMYIEGSWISHIGSYTTADGQTHDIVDAWFETEQGTMTHLLNGGDYYGSNDADVFLFGAIEDGLSVIQDFDISADSLDLSAVVEGFDPVTDAIQDFVYVTQSGDNTIISVDADGKGDGAAVEVVQLDNVSGQSLEDLFDNSNIVV